MVESMLVEKLLGVADKIGCHGHTPLHLAAQEGQKEVAEVLLDKGAVVDTKD